MPGHKGASFLGCEALDITEIAGADSLYEASGIIAESEQIAAGLFGAGKTLYSTEGSSACIRAMLYLALSCRKAGALPVVVAARNVHKAFVYAAALLDFEIVWLWPEKESRSLCACPISAETLRDTLAALPAPPAAVYLTSPDYLGGMADIATLAPICHAADAPLLLDNAHGAYLHFLEKPCHPLDLGADICCDSAHKTLPVLTGGAYLQISQTAPAAFAQNARQALALFGSTSPSYLILQSLDLANRYLADDYPRRLAQTAALAQRTKQSLQSAGWVMADSDPLRLVVDAGACGHTGIALADRLRLAGVECEYADPESLVLMLTPETDPSQLALIQSALGENDRPQCRPAPLPMAKGERRLSVRQALFAPHESLPAADSAGRVCAAPTVACPPAIPIAVSGETIGSAALALFAHYGVETVEVVRQDSD